MTVDGVMAKDILPTILTTVSLKVQKKKIPQKRPKMWEQHQEKAGQAKRSHSWNERSKTDKGITLRL